MANKLWKKGYDLEKDIEFFTVGNDYLLDLKLVKYDCLASIAHAKMLNKTGILTEDELKKITEVLNKIIELDAKKEFTIEIDEEDCHTAIENYLVARLGDTGKKIHTARSRNDQVLAALRLMYKEEIKKITSLIDKFIAAGLQLKEKHGSIEMPGYTHMRKAMPSSVGLWVGAFIESMEDNKTLLINIAKLVDQSPLGTGAGYDLPIEVDRKMTSDLLGFAKIQNNPIYVQNSRGKFESSILHALTQIMLDLNKLATDLIMFSMSNFGYFELPAEICTGSSIMPQKKNPDVLELVRAKYHTVLACEFEVKNMSSNLISGYNRDMQLTKKSIIKGLRITKKSLSIMRLVLEKLKVNEENCKKAMTDELYATKKAYELVKKGTPFRDAYKEISKDFMK